MGKQFHFLSSTLELKSLQLVWAHGGLTLVLLLMLSLLPLRLDIDTLTALDFTATRKRLVVH